MIKIMLVWEGIVFNMVWVSCLQCIMNCLICDGDIILDIFVLLWCDLIFLVSFCFCNVFYFIMYFIEGVFSIIKKLS